MGRTILIAEDEQVLRESVAGLLTDEGYDVLQAGSGRQAHEILIQNQIDLILSDMRMPDGDGMELLGYARQIAPETPFIVMTAYGTVDSAVHAMRNGAWDYLLKPVQFDDLLVKIDRALEFEEVSHDRRVMADQLAEESTFHNLVSEAPVMLEMFGRIRKLSQVGSSVLLVGESGTGKELLARAIHYNGVTRNKPFVAVNSGAIPESLLESELFGHRKGAFTGAVRDKEGYFEAANNGTLFLDEISTLPLSLQSSLLRVLEERVVVPVGDTTPRPIDVRVISASNQNLERMVEDGGFREDLYFRLNVVMLEVPPLRHRRGDIPLLVYHFLQKYTAEMGKTVSGITNGAMRALLHHEWRGNVRELENVIERAVIFAEEKEIGVTDLPFAAGDVVDDVDDNLKEALRLFEKQHIVSSLHRHHYDKAATAIHLGIGISSLYRKMEELDISKSPDRPGGDGEAQSAADIMEVDSQS